MYQRLKLRIARVLARAGLLGLALRVKRAILRAGSRVARRYRRGRARRILRAVPPGRVVVYHENHWCAAFVDDRLRQIDVMERNLAMVVGILEEIGVPYAYVPVTSTHRLRIAVPASARRKVLEHLGRSRDDGLHLRTGELDAWLGIPAVRRPPAKRLLKSPEIRVYRAVTDPGGNVVFGSLFGCSLEFWRESPNGALASSLGDTLVSTAAPGEFGAAEVDLRTMRVRTLPVVADKTLFSVQQFPVDLVYTWVDGDDPDWRTRKERVTARLHPGRSTVDSDAPERFVHRDELRFSLRSVSQFAEFVRHVYLVTDRQVPAWLDGRCPRISVVDHRDIFPDPECLPTFNSHAIESRLHHIEGLSEHFVYMNDDFLFGRRVLHTTFFHPNGIAKFFMSGAVLSNESLSVDHAARNAADLLESEFGVRVTNKMKHAPYALRRSTLAALEARFPDAFARTARHQLRSPDDIPVASSMGHYFGSFLGTAVPGTIANAYVDIGHPGLEEILEQIAETRNYDVICLNDSVSGEVDAEGRDAAVRRWLESYYPVPSEFESG